MALPLPVTRSPDPTTILSSSASLLDQIQIHTEPRGAFGRFFLCAEQQLHEAGLSARLVPPPELVRINDANRDNWAPLIAVVDHRAFPPAGDDMQCLACYDRNGQAVATSVVRRFDMSRSNVAEELKSLRLLFGPRAVEMSNSVEFILTAPSAGRITGQILYHGGVWVHPKMRKHGITRIVPKLNRYIALARHPFDYEIAMASAALLKPHVAASYSVEGCEPYYAYKSEGAVKWEGVFNWSSRDWIIATLHNDLASMSVTSTSEDIRGDEKQPAVAALNR